MNKLLFIGVFVLAICAFVVTATSTEEEKFTLEQLLSLPHTLDKAKLTAFSYSNCGTLPFSCSFFCGVCSSSIIASLTPFFFASSPRLGQRSLEADAAQHLARPHHGRPSRERHRQGLPQCVSPPLGSFFFSISVSLSHCCCWMAGANITSGEGYSMSLEIYKKVFGVRHILP